LCERHAAAGKAGAAKLKVLCSRLARAGDARRLRLRAHAPESLPRRLRRPRYAVGPV